MNPSLQIIFLIALIIMLILSAVILIVCNKKKVANLTHEKALLVEKIKNQKALEEPKKIESETELKKLEEKNRKLWQMSETVHKERKKIEEQNELLQQEKQKLELAKQKLDEKVKKLWNTSTVIHKEKERINELKIHIEHKHQEILDSVNYAQRIQKALLANKKLLDENLPQYFVLFMPKDIVSGDFYWAHKLADGSFSIVTADSTGHGVPGAIMSILNISCLNEAVNAQHLIEPDQILNYTRKRIMEHMANDGSEEGGKDGMDAIICNFNFQSNEIAFAAANNPLWIIRQNELIEYKADKMPVGKPMGEILPFTQHKFTTQKNDLIIMITDGMADQFGGPKGKKFMYKPLKELILSLANKNLDEIKNTIEQNFMDWKGNHEQVDDVCIIGVRI